MAKESYHYVEGNNGGSFVALRETDRAGIVRLEVGETCVVTIDEEVSVVGLSAVLTIVKKIGWDKFIKDNMQGFDFDMKSNPQGEKAR